MPAALAPKFKDLQPLAQGQTGTLQLATHVQSGKRGVLKVIPLAGFEGSERVRLKRELRKQTKLAHDGLPRILDGGELEAELWLFREYVSGDSLAQRIRMQGRLAPTEALLIAAQVASALDELQRNGLLHRDVKPGHVILQAGPNGLPISKLIDAGVAARLPSGSVFDLVGTPAYISPEQVAGKLISFRSDLYALGCMLFEMLTGKPPYVAGDVAAVLEAHKSAPLPELPAELNVPPQAVSLLRGLLAKEPRQRPFSAQQVRRTLEPLLPPGAPLPILQSRAPSSAGGISAPPPASRGRAKPDSGKAPPVPKAGRGAANAPAERGEFPTQEIELDDIEPLPPAPNTIQLVPDDLEELEDAALAPGPTTINLGPEDIEAIEVRELAATLSGAPPEPESASEVAPESEAAHDADAPVAEPEPEPEPDAQSVAQPGTPQEPAPAASAAPAESSKAPGAQPASSPPARRAVDFDVESLFDDEVPAPVITAAPTSLNEAAPTQIYRPDAPIVRGAVPEPERKKPESKKPESKKADSKRPKAKKRDSKAPPHDEADRDPEGTVMVARPGAKPSRPVWPWIAGAAAVLLVVVLVAVSGDDEPVEVAGAEQPSTDAPATAGAAPAERVKDESAQQHAAIAQPGTPSAAGEAERERSAQDEPAAASQPTPGAAEQAQAPSPSGAQPATTAQPEPAEQSANTLSAAAASAKLGPSAGSKLVAPRASRAERLAKADEWKKQGRAHYQAGRYREAATAYQNATELDPSDAGAFAGLAASRLASGDSNAAIAAYSRAVRLQPDSSGFHAALGRAYLANGDRGRARAAYQKALELNPNNGAAKTALQQLN